MEPEFEEENLRKRKALYRGLFVKALSRWITGALPYLLCPRGPDDGLCRGFICFYCSHGD
ncbi:hypothetical protein Scep_021180 [Stephania cephalantha]|uniref:Uncharacterized protein n=1 Tax=Stephania cephalantha TaxID=152367 RepID=A0AAP0F454_9MAGN